MNLQLLETKLHYNFQNKSLLREALTHPSVKKAKSYERLEFLGNSILGAALADIIYCSFPDLSEGKLSVIFSKMSSTDGINNAISEIKLGDYMLLDKGEEKNNGRKNIKNIENCCEAIIAAIYLDGGYYAAKDFVKRFWLKHIESIDDLTNRDPKSQLQELCQKLGYPLPNYTIASMAGPVHAPEFTIICSVDTNKGFVESDSRSKSKKSGEIESAKKVLELLKSL